MKRIAAVVLAIGLACGVALAQETNDAPATKEDVAKLFETMHIHEQMHNMMEVMFKQSRQIAQDALKKRVPEITQKDLDRMDAMMDRMQKQLDVDGILDDMIPVYQKHLTKEDVAAMQAFYGTPTGQKILREQPAMTAEAMRAVQPRTEKMMNNIMDEVEKMAKEGAKPANAVKD